jgi:hypothetical protein
VCFINLLIAASVVDNKKAQKGYKGFKVQKVFRLPGGKCLADASPKALKHYLPFVLFAILGFRTFFFAIA